MILIGIIKQMQPQYKFVT